MIKAIYKENESLYYYLPLIPSLPVPIPAPNWHTRTHTHTELKYLAEQLQKGIKLFKEIWFEKRFKTGLCKRMPVIKFSGI